MDVCEIAAKSWASDSVVTTDAVREKINETQHLRYNAFENTTSEEPKFGEKN
jgi:hypothetical protein